MGKTAVALKLSYNILADENNPYSLMIWFSAKETKLEPDGIKKIESGIKGYSHLLENILEIVDSETYKLFKNNKIDLQKYEDHLKKFFSSKRCLIIIDNLETIIEDQKIIEFIKNIPRPSQILITSRKGLGEIEKRYPLPDFDKKSAITLFKLISKENNRKDLLNLNEECISLLVKKVKYYPLLIKWSLGKVFLGMDINEALSEIYEGKTEIAEFVFNDVFKILNSKSKNIIYSMIILGDKPITKEMIKYITDLNDDDFEDGIKELMITSFIYQEISEEKNKINTNYKMLSLTRGFFQIRLDEDIKTKNILLTKYYELRKLIHDSEKSEKAYEDSLFSLGIKNDNDRISYTRITSAKNFIKSKNYEKAEKNFKEAIKISPNFSYALKKYAIFEFKRKHYNESNSLFERAIEADKENFSLFFSYGLNLRKQQLVKDSVKMLEKANDLNPKNLRILNQLGRSYSFDGQYEKANELFEKAKMNGKKINNKDKLINIYFQADNFRRESEKFFEVKDEKTGMIKLHNSLDLIKNTNKFRKNDIKLRLLEKNAYRNIAIQLCKLGKFNEAEIYFEKCFEKIILNNMSLSYDEEMAKAYYFFSEYAFKLEIYPLEKIQEYIKKGLNVLNKINKHKNNNLIDKFHELKENIEEENRKKFLKYGEIQWYNVKKKFGVVKSGNETFLFFLNEFKKKLTDTEIKSLKDSKISFIPLKDPKNKNKEIASNISLEY